MASFEDRVKSLTRTDLLTIQNQYDAAMDTSHGSGEHWALIAALNQKGFSVRTVDQAIETAEKIITLWYSLNS
jgi:hypothetical protein